MNGRTITRAWCAQHGVFAALTLILVGSAGCPAALSPEDHHTQFHVVNAMDEAAIVGVFFWPAYSHVANTNAITTIEAGSMRVLPVGTAGSQAVVIVVDIDGKDLYSPWDLSRFFTEDGVLREGLRMWAWHKDSPPVIWMPYGHVAQVTLTGGSANDDWWAVWDQWEIIPDETARR